MKNIHIILCLLCIAALTSCSSVDTKTWAENLSAWVSENNISPNTTQTMAKEVVSSGDQVEVHYVGTLENGEVFDSSRDRGQTLGFTVGAGQMISGFDAGVVGMKLWETKTLTLSPSEAYGERADTAQQTVPKADLASFTAAGFTLEVWEELPTQMGNFPIIAADEETITLDMNHPLAGKTLIFEVEIIKIQ